MREKLTSFMEESFMFQFDDRITPESDLFKAGVVDSYGYIRLIRYLETEFGVRFSEDEILDNVFVSLTSLLDCVTAKIAA